MRATRVVKAVVVIALFVGMAFTQSQTEKPKAAVYIMGNPEGRDALRMAVNTFLVKSGKYQMVAVDAIDVVAKEHKRQMSGSVSDAQIAKLGQDAGAQYVCVVERTELDGYSYVATRMVSVQSKVAEFADMVKLPYGGDIIEIIQWQIGSMLGMVVGPRPGSTQSASPPPTQPVAAIPQQTSQMISPTSQQARIDGSGMLTDSRDGKKYKTVVIGSKRWMAENLNYQTPNDSWCFHANNCAKYGRLYTWHLAVKGNACPIGWHLPSSKEWDDMITVTGGSSMAGKKLKSTSGWFQYGNGTDNFGFSALPAGYRSAAYQSHKDDGERGLWWTATDNEKGRAYNRYMSYEYDQVNGADNDKYVGFSVRCVQD